MCHVGAIINRPYVRGDFEGRLIIAPTKNIKRTPQGKETKMKKKIKWILALCCVFFLLTATVSAEGGPTEDLLKAGGGEQLQEAVDSETAEYLKELGIEKIKPGNMLQVTMDSIAGLLLNILRQKSRNPIKMAMVTAGVILLCALLKSTEYALGQDGPESILDVVAALFISTTVLMPISGVITLTGKVIEACTAFMAVYVPVFAGILAANGQLKSAASYTTLLMGATQGVSLLNAFVITPFVSAYFAMCMAGAISPAVKIRAVAEWVKGMAVSLLTVVSTIFVILLSVQSMVAGAGDTMTMKTAKFLSGSFIPIVGGAVSEALSTLSGCMSVLKASVGAYGIVTVALIFVPLIAELLLWQLCVSFGTMLADMLGVKVMSDLLSCAAAALKVLLAVSVVCGAVFIISTTIMVKAGMSVG